MDKIDLRAMNMLVEMAAAHADGHLTILKFTTNWRICFFTPDGREDIDEMAVGDTFLDAAQLAIAKFTAEVRQRAITGT